jgi:hypothetical protein
VTLSHNKFCLLANTFYCAKNFDEKHPLVYTKGLALLPFGPWFLPCFAALPIGKVKTKRSQSKLLGYALKVFCMPPKGLYPLAFRFLPFGICFSDRQSKNKSQTFAFALILCIKVGLSHKSCEA